MTVRDEWDEKAVALIDEILGCIVAAVLREQAEKHKAELAKSLVVIKQEAKRADDNFILTEQLRAQLAAAHDRAEWCNKLYDGRE